MTRISIKEQFKDDHVTRDAGEKLRLMILNAAKSGTPIELDFAGLIIGSASFFDEGIVKLLSEGWDKNKLSQTLLLKNINKRDLEVLERLKKLRNP